MKKIILIFLMFLSVNVFSQTLTTYYSFKTYPNSANRNIYWYGVNFSRIDSVLHVLSTGSSFSLSDFHAFTGINTFANGTYFNDSAKFTRIVIMDSLKVNNRISGYGPLIDSLSASFLRSGTVPMARLSDSTFKLSNLDTTRFMDLSDTSHYVHTDTLTTESVKSVVGFWNLVTFYTTATFAVSPVFSALVNFANGITTTTFYASGYSRMGELSRNEKKVTKSVYLSAINTTYTVAHGISRVENVTSCKLMVKHDSTGAAVPQILPQGYNATTAQAVGNSVWMDSLLCYYFLASTSTGLIGDSAIFEITYTDNH